MCVRAIGTVMGLTRLLHAEGVPAWLFLLRRATIFLGAVNLGLIVAVWTVYRSRILPKRSSYVTFMLVWGAGLILVSSDVTVTKFGIMSATWHTPTLFVVYAIGCVGFGRMLRYMRHERLGPRLPPRRPHPSRG
jgi:hypothetical protein